MTITTEKNIPKFANEAGLHRIQRVSPTERRGRVHTSTTTVSVLMEHDAPDSPYMKRSSDDYEYRWYSGTGKGGQHRNRHMCCLEITHLPTGISQKADGRSRASNENIALESLHQKLDQMELLDSGKNINKVRSKQIGNGNRGNDKIRTYRFQENIVYDHISGKKMNCKKFMKGSIDKLWK